MIKTGTRRFSSADHGTMNIIMNDLKIVRIRIAIHGKNKPDKDDFSFHCNPVIETEERQNRITPGQDFMQTPAPDAFSLNEYSIVTTSPSTPGYISMLCLSTLNEMLPI